MNDATQTVIVQTTHEPIAAGPFQPTWESLQQYRYPDWFRDAKFGIWAHWGPQCQPEHGDWYARGMYEKGGGHNKWHVEHYGDPAQFGFKDVIHAWKAERWDPAELVRLYKRAGAQYFFAMANHHDNFDLWDSTYQPWNSVAIGPKKNIMDGWAKAARAAGLKFGVSVHAAHAWHWLEPSQDYDGNSTNLFHGLNPQDLYAQRHPRSEPRSIGDQWGWGNGCSRPDQAYCDKFYNRTVDLINRYKPDLIYFDDTVLPLWPISDAGFKIAAHFYNRSPRGVLFGKVLNEAQRKCITWDIECGVPPTGLPLPWQTCTCIGNWHYSRDRFDQKNYKSARTVVHMLADIVSKNGNLLLSVPVRADGTIDELERKIVGEIGDWMDLNKEAIFGARPWKVFGEGPASEGAPLHEQGFNEGKGKPFTAEDIRFTTKGHALYAIVLGVPTAPVSIRSLKDQRVSSVELLGGTAPVKWEQGADGVTIQIPGPLPSQIAVTLKIGFRNS